MPLIFSQSEQTVSDILCLNLVWTKALGREWTNEKYYQILAFLHVPVVRKINVLCPPSHEKRSQPQLCADVNDWVAIVVYLAQVRKTAPAGHSRPHSLTRLNESKYCKETQLLPISLLTWLSSWFLISKETFKSIKKTLLTWPCILATLRPYMTKAAWDLSKP